MLPFRPHLPFGKTTLLKLQVGGARQPSLDDFVIIQILVITHKIYRGVLSAYGVQLDQCTSCELRPI
jgi:hypothetical protein